MYQVVLLHSLAVHVFELASLKTFLFSLSRMAFIVQLHLINYFFSKFLQKKENLIYSCVCFMPCPYKLSEVCIL